MYGMSGIEFQEFYDAYADAMLWANTYDEDGIPADSSRAEVDPSARDQMEQDCDNFLDDSAVRLIRGAMRRNRAYCFADAGHDFALTRNGHGVGFWDRGLGIVGEALTKIAKPYGEAHLWVDSSGIVHPE